VSEKPSVAAPSGRRRGRSNPYRRLGIILAVSGAATAPFFYFVAVSVPLTAVSLSSVILGLVSAMLSNARPDISPEASRMMMLTGMENIAALLEELGLTTRAIYLPSSKDGVRPKAIVPLKESELLPEITQQIPDRLIARYGANMENMCLVVRTPGGFSLDDIPGIHGGGREQIEGVLNQVLVGVMDLADSVSLHANGDILFIDVAGPKLKYENVWYYRCLGSPLASIAATVISQALSKPVRIKNETCLKKNTVRIEVEILP
jgi:hypothetical protein